jgi:hypothetical protein
VTALRKGEHLTEEHKRAFCYSNRGKHLTQEHKQKLRESHIGLLSGEKHPLYGKHHTDESKRKMRASHLGKKLPDEQKRKISENNGKVWKGKHLSENHRRKLSESHKGKKPWNVGISTIISDEQRRRTSETLKRKIRDGTVTIKNLKPSGPELYLDFLLQNNFPDEWQYTGDGTIRIGGLFPDFINCNGRKKIIELFGVYWHTGTGLKNSRTEVGRRDIFNDCGYDLLVIWDYEMIDEDLILKKIGEFIR